MVSLFELHNKENLLQPPRFLIKIKKKKILANIFFVRKTNCATIIYSLYKVKPIAWVFNQAQIRLAKLSLWVLFPLFISFCWIRLSLSFFLSISRSHVFMNSYNFSDYKNTIEILFYYTKFFLICSLFYSNLIWSYILNYFARLPRIELGAFQKVEVRFN